MSKNTHQQMPQEEISLTEIIKFLLDTWRTILVFGVLGFMSSVAHLLVTPKHYEAIAQIQMAQINTSNNHVRNLSNSNNSYPLGVNIEEPNLLLARMRVPSSYSEIEFKACGLGYSKASAEKLTRLAQFSQVKGVTSAIELRIQMESKDQAISCAQSLFENIRSSQNQIIKPYIEEAKSRIINYQAQIEGLKIIIAREDKSSSISAAAYLANRDELKFLMEENIRLKTFITAGDVGRAKLVAPIYVSDVPVFPRKKNVLLGGLFLGLIFGLVFTVGKKYLIILKER